MKSLFVLLSVFLCGCCYAQTTNNIVKLLLSSNYQMMSTNYAGPATFQRDNESRTTNIVIAVDFKGTIQVGSNFFTVSNLSSRVAISNTP